MKRILRVLLLLAILSALAVGVFLLSCTERVPNVTRTNITQHGEQAHQQHVFFNELKLQLNNRYQLLTIEIYLPYVDADGIPDGPIPILFLFPPQDGDYLYYFNRGLLEVADELIANGTIKPMAIACVDNAPILGGVFAGGNSPAAGAYDELIGDSLFPYLDKFYPGFFDAAASKHGVGGIGLGAYGAVRAAILHPDKFSSVSVTDGPLDFDGASGSDGFYPLFTQALNEQGLWGDTQYLTKFDTGDGTHSWKVSRMLLGAALVFSPHDTSAFAYTRFIDRAPAGPGPEDQTVTDSVCVQTITDSVTDLRNVLIQSYRSCGGGTINFGDMHLPFDSHGGFYDPIWNTLWLPNSPDQLLAAHSTALNNTKFWFGTTQQSEFNYYPMTQSFISTLKGAPYNLTNNITEYKLVSTPELNATDGQYTYDLLKQILIFHNKNFNP